MQRFGKHTSSTGIVRSIVVLATLAMVWMAAGAPFESAF